MPSIADITVKKADGTTDITFSALNPAGGDGIPAIFRSQTVGTVPGHKPEIRISTKGKTGARVMRLTARYPNVKTIDGVETLVSPGSRFSSEFQLDEKQDQADIDEAAEQFSNVQASVLVKSCAKTGFPPV